VTVPGPLRLRWQPGRLRRADVDHVVSHALQRGLVTVPDLVQETHALGRRATPWLRAAVEDAGRGMRSVLARQNALHGAGSVLLRFPVRRLRADPGTCASEIRALAA
jgi:hypothetical protein